MAQTKTPTAPDTAQYTVLRAICMAGERVEVGATVELTRSQYNEAFAAGKVGPLREAAPAAKPAPKTKEAPQ